MLVRRQPPLCLVAAALASGCVLAGCAGGSDTDVGTGAATNASAADSVAVPAEQPPPTSGDDGLPADGRTFEEVCGDAPADTYCGVTQDELHAMNMHYADRLDFVGDPAEAAITVGVVRELLAPFVGTSTQPSAEDVAAALDGLESVQTSTNAVGAAGTAFAVAVDGGCVFGAVLQGELTVELGGFVNDGGCLASYGH